MPARTSHSPRGFPRDFRIILARLPEGEVEWIFLLLIVSRRGSLAGAQTKLVDVLSRQLAVAVEHSRSVVYVSVNFVGVSFIDEIRNEFDNIIHGLSYLRMNCRLLDVQSRRVLEVFLDVLLGDFSRAYAFLLCSVYYLVINVGEVLNELDLVASVLEILSHGIEYYERSGVSYVKEIVHGRSADVHFDLAFLLRYELLFSSCQCVIYLHHFLLSFAVFSA